MLTGVENDLLTQAVGARAMVADRAETAGGRIDLRLEELVADAAVVGQAQPAGRWRRSWRPLAGEPCEPQSRNLDHHATDAVVELAGLDRAALRNHARHAAQFQGDAAVEAARVEQEIAGVIRLTAGRQAPGQDRRRQVLRLRQFLRGGRRLAFHAVFQARQVFLERTAVRRIDAAAEATVQRRQRPGRVDAAAGATCRAKPLTGSRRSSPAGRPSGGLARSTRASPWNSSADAGEV